MPVVIQKFGGKLLETPENIRRVARYIISTMENGDHPVVVVSALGQMTDQYIRMANEVTNNPDKRELDMLLSVGERTSMALLAMAINDSGSFHAVSFTGSQVGIITDTSHTDARILEVKGYRIKEAIAAGQIPIIAGFQGVSTEKEITTLGRGGSDATAVALAVALEADRCELIKECGGVYTADPLIIPNAVKHREMDYDTFEEISAAGAAVVQSRAAALAKQHKVTLSIKGPDRSSGTLVSDSTLTAGTVAAVLLQTDLSIETVDLDRLAEQDFSSCLMITTSGNTARMTVNSLPETANAEPAYVITIVGSGDVLPASVLGKVMKNLLSNGVIPIAICGLHGQLGLVFNQGIGHETLEIVYEACRQCGFFPRQ